MIPNGIIDKSEILKIQEMLSFELDEDYFQFLLNNNGAKFKGEVVHIPDLNQEVMLDMLWGINLEEEVLNLAFWMKEYQDEIPPESIIIGDDPGGGLFLIIKDQGVYYWDHSWFFEQSNEEENTYFVAPSFSEFMNKLKQLD